jgi:hypothetical protein
MHKVVVEPTQWTRVQDMNDIRRELSEKDAECFAELREVLKKHDSLERFGIMLLHRHFELQDGECLLETMDLASRTLTVQPVSAQEVSSSVQTQWKLSSQDPLQWCSGYCHYNNGHKHGHTKGISTDGTATST